MKEQSVVVADYINNKQVLNGRAVPMRRAAGNHAFVKSRTTHPESGPSSAQLGAEAIAAVQAAKEKKRLHKNERAKQARAEKAAKRKPEREQPDELKSKRTRSEVFFA